MKIQYVDYPLSTLKEWLNPDNPRWMSEDTFAHLKTSLDNFGCVEPVIVNKARKMVIGGHQRISAALELGKKSLPAIELNLTEDKEKALSLLLNKVGGEWDFQKLAECLNTLDEEAIALCGFSHLEVDVILAEQKAALSIVSNEVRSRESESVRSVEASLATAPKQATETLNAKINHENATAEEKEEDEDEEDFSVTGAKEEEEEENKASKNSTTVSLPPTLEITDDSDEDDEEEEDSDEEDESNESDEDVGTESGAQRAFGIDPVPTSSRTAEMPECNSGIASSILGGVTQQLRNKTNAEVEEQFAATVKVQFGMFSREYPAHVYDKWVKGLERQSSSGSNPAALGAVVARRIGIVETSKEEINV